jgi:murein DD-endopeptidase MepM/ murein hydrolase activator NlpD
VQVGWTGLGRAIGLTAALTSALWIALGAWLFHAHINEDHRGRRDQAARTEPARQGVLGGVAAPAALPVHRVGTLSVPVAGVAPDKLVDTFAQGREEGARRHDALDIMAAEGAPVVAAAPGQVEKLFYSEAGGNTIYVRSTDRRMIFYYAHLAAYARGLHEGMAVRGGQFLGTVGHTGNASAEAPHLHFAMWNVDPAQGWSQATVAVDPYPFLAGKVARPAQ